MIPNLSALSFDTRAEDEEDVGVDLLQLGMPGIPGMPAAVQQVFDYLSRWRNNVPAPPTQSPNKTSDLWKKGMLNTTEAMQDWDHLTRVTDILAFFNKAASKKYDSLAHVIFAKKKHETDLGDKVGHLAIVFEPFFQQAPGTRREVVSIGFYPGNDRTDNQTLLGYSSNGTVVTPDYTVARYHKYGPITEAVTGVKFHEGAYDVTLLKTFTYSAENMGKWAALFENRKNSGVEWNNVLSYAEYNLFAGFELGSILQLVSSLTSLIFDTPVLSLAGPQENNCATWIVNTFPEAEMVCPAGIPSLCTPKEEVYQSLEDGLENMKKSLESFFQKTKIDPRVPNLALSLAERRDCLKSVNLVGQYNQKGHRATLGRNNHRLR
jgi:hypothetical protein